jgi:glutamyl-tRNA synthetase
VLRLEDLDVDRSRPEYADAARRDLEWLGLDWDRERLQSEGLERIRAAAAQLVDDGRAYPCVCSRGDVRRSASAPHGKEPRYPGTCRGRYTSLEQAERLSHKAAGLRFRSDDEEYAFDDGLCGHQRENLARVSGDFLVLRRDKHPAYHLAVVVDDAFDEVTEVVRGDDLLDSTPKHLALGRALGLPTPNYFHVPLVTGPDGVRLAKRAPRLSLAQLRTRGVDPRSVVAWAARSAGLDDDGACSARELATGFDFSRVPRSTVQTRGEFG